MGFVSKFVRSSIGAKVVMALTGVVLVGFVLGHMLGNLQIYAGPDVYNAYAHALKSMPLLLWGTRITLLACVFLHVASALRLTQLNRKARPVAYAQKRWLKASLSSRTMALSGLTLLAFVVFHILHFTVGCVQPEHFTLVDHAGRHDVYAMFVLGFSNVWVSLSYIVAMVLLGLHLNHGISSMFQSLGLYHPQYNCFIRALGPVVSTVVVLGNVSMPLAVLSGCLTLSTGGM
jgi:succinate dehydrogenase / fumarate reductase cytochrome b subunit